MEAVLDVGMVVLLLVGLCVCWVLTLIGMPGNWLMILVTATFAWFVPADSRMDVGWPTLLLLTGLAVAGELVEFAASAWGATRAGGSWLAAFLSLLGSVLGGLLGLTAGLPLSPIGPIVGVLLLAALGAAVGAMVGEDWAGRDVDHGWQVGKAAFWGRLWGTAGKVSLGSVMVVIVLLALVTG